MEVKDLVLNTYRVERIGGVMLAREDPKGNYQASCAEDVEIALTIGPKRGHPVFVRTGSQAPWHQIETPSVSRRRRAYRHRRKRRRQPPVEHPSLGGERQVTKVGLISKLRRIWSKLTFL
jgi:hypothetical protein